MIEDECGAPDFFSGMRMVPVEGPLGRMDLANLEARIARYPQDAVHHGRAAAITMTQATEVGTVYTLDEIEAISRTAKAHGLPLHMDGARFANALSFVGCSPAEMTWMSGVDVLSFGATKNGALAAEIVVFFQPELAREFEFRRKRAGHLFSKMRFVSAQLDAYLSDGLWLANARHANQMARRLVAGLSTLKGAQLLYPVDANEIFVILPPRAHDALQAAGAKYHSWPSDRPGERAYRLVTAFDTDPADVDRFLSIAKQAA